MIRLVISCLLIVSITSCFAQSHKEKAEAAFSKQDWEVMIENYKRHLKKEKKDSLAQFRIGFGYHQLKKFEQANTELNKAKDMGFNELRVDFYLTK
ncbi:MAG: hypothetical protein Tsb0034_04950 [Ekhidna sp.]